MKIEFSVLLFTFTYSLSQKIVKSHVSNYLNIKKINTKFTCNSLQFVSKNEKLFFQILISRNKRFIAL
jgi:hypothetical protein